MLISLLIRLFDVFYLPPFAMLYLRRRLCRYTLMLLAKIYAATRATPCRHCCRCLMMPADVIIAFRAFAAFLLRRC